MSEIYPTSPFYTAKDGAIVPFNVPINKASGSTSTIAGAVTGKRIRCISGCLSSQTATFTTADFFDDINDIAPVSVGQTPTVLPENASGWFETATGEELKLTVGAGAGIFGWLRCILYTP